MEHSTGTSTGGPLTGQLQEKKQQDIFKRTINRVYTEGPSTVPTTGRYSNQCKPIL